MTRYMYDGINTDASYIHSNYSPQLVAGYINGTFAWSQADWDLFPKAVHVYITYTASAHGTGIDVLDVETGDATPAQTEGWIANMKAAGYNRPTIYCNLSTVPAVRAGTGKYVLGKDYDLWIADYDNSTSDVYSGMAAKQYKNSAYDDESVVYDDNWPHRTSAPPAPAKPDIPGHGKTSSITSTSAVISYTGVTGGVKYDIQVVTGDTASGAQAWRETVGGESGSGVKVTGLKPATKYSWRIAAYNSANVSSGWSGLIPFTTASDPSTWEYPAPAGLGIGQGTASIPVHWDAVAHNGVDAPSYTLLILDSAGKTFQTFPAVKGTSQLVTVPRGKYTARVWGNGSTKGSPHTDYEFTV